MTMPAQPPAAARTRKQAVTEKRLDAGRAVAYCEQWCLRAPSRPSPDFGKKQRGGPTLIRHTHGVVARHPAATRTTTKTTLTLNDATTPTTLTLNGG
jgi:hypothetical protein